MASSTPSLNYNQMDRFKKRKIRIIKIIIKINFNRVAEQHPVFQSTRESRRKSFSVKTKNSASARTCFPISFIHIYIYISRHTITSLLKKTSVPFPTEKRRIERPVDRKKWKRIKRIARFVISAFLPEKEARATGRAAASLRVDWKGKRVRGGENEEGPDASMKSHVPSRVHRNVGRLATVSGYARACWWSPGFSSAQVDATRAPHARRARGTAEGSGGHRVSVVEQQRWRLARGRGEAGTEYGRGH